MDDERTTKKVDITERTAALVREQAVGSGHMLGNRSEIQG